MTPPSQDQIRVALDALRREAGIWDCQANELAKIRPKAEALRLNRIEAGLFQVIFDTYSQVLGQIIDRADEGQRCMIDVGSALRAVAATYEREEAEYIHQLRDLY